jgi:hypothetical protein
MSNAQELELELEQQELERTAFESPTPGVIVWDGVIATIVDTTTLTPILFDGSYTTKD